MYSMSFVQVIPVTRYLRDEKDVLVPLWCRGCQKVYFLVDSSSDDIETEMEARDSFVDMLEKNGYIRQEKITVTVDFTSIEDCMEKLGEIMGKEKDSTELYYNATFQTGVLNIAGLIACSIADRDVVVRNLDTVVYVPKYRFEILEDPLKISLLSSIQEKHGTGSFSLMDGIALMEEIYPKSKKKRSLALQYNRFREFLNGMKSRGYLEERETASKNAKKVKVTQNGVMTVKLFTRFLKSYGKLG